MKGLLIVIFSLFFFWKDFVHAGIIFVDNPNDFAGNSTNCVPISTGLCNFRSAWSACATINESCLIYLLGGTMRFNPQIHGTLRVMNSTNITVYGQNSEFVYDSNTAMRTKHIHSIISATNDSTLMTDPSLTYSFYSYGYGYYSFYGYSYYGGGGSDDNHYYYSPSTTADTPLFTYHNPSPLSPPPMVTFRNISFTGFASPDGGAPIITSNGNIKLHFDQTYFQYNLGSDSNGIFIQNSLYGEILITNSVFYRNRDKDSYPITKGVLYFQNVRNIYIANVTFQENRGDIGAMYFDQVENAYVDTLSSREDVGSAFGGFGIERSRNIYLENLFVQKSTCEVDFICFGGGALYMTESQNVSITYSSFVNNSAPAEAGGCLLMDSDNHNITIAHTLFEACHTGGYGGALAILSRNTRLNMYNLTFLRTYAIEYKASNFGGSIYLGNSNNFTMFQHVKIENSHAGVGGAVYLARGNAYVTFQNMSIQHTKSIYGGGGIMIADSNQHITLKSIHIYHTTASSGGALQFQNNNHDILLQDVVVHNASAVMDSSSDTTTSNSYTMNSGCGGGIYVGQQNFDFQVVNSHIRHSRASVAGGGIYFDNSNSNFVFLRSKIHNCSAAQNGGGAYVATNNGAIFFVGSELTNNNALLSGGGVYNQLNNPLLTFVDFDAYKKALVVESSHPYESRPPIPGAGAQPISYNKAQFSSPITIMIVFDPRTNIRSQEDSITIRKQNKQVVFKSTTNTAFPGVTLPVLIIKQCTYIEIEFDGPPTSSSLTTTAMNYYGFKSYFFPIFSNPSQPTLFTNNHAAYGGAFYSFNNLAFPLFGNVYFNRNHADVDGGAMYFRVNNYGVAIEACTFANNYCQTYGGAIYFSTANYGAVLSDCKISNNTAKTGFGGGLAMLNENGIGVFTSGNTMNITNCVFANNVASTGGGLYAATSNVFTVTKNQYLHNSANFSNGGGMALQSANIVELKNNVFANNYAATLGGALSIFDNSVVTLSGNATFRKNLGLVGGAISLVQAPIWLTKSNTNTTIIQNEAGRGSAIFFYQTVSSSNQLQSISFVSNVATVGGTIYWIKDAVMTSPPAGLDSSTLQWRSNVAPYGIMVATQAVQLIVPMKYSVNVYNKPLVPYMTLHLLDAYGQFIPLNNPTTSVVVSIPDQYLSQAQCSSSFPYLSGDNTVGSGVIIANGGYAVFDNLQVFCSPIGNVTIQFQAKLGDLVPVLSSAQTESYYISNHTFLSFRPCIAGEYEGINSCYDCPSGTFTLTGNSKECVDCTQTAGVSSCATNQIILKTGYWRRYDNTQAVMKCPSGSKSCLGGNVTGDALCAIGYGGPLCNVCSDGYYKSDGNTCAACHGSDLFSPTLIAVIVVGFVGAMTLWIAYLYNTALFVVDTNATTTGLYGQLVFLGLALYDFWKTQSKSIMIRFKVIVSTFQVVTVTATVFSVTIPDNLSNFLGSFRFFNLRFSTIFPVGCALNSFDFIQNLMITTLFPIGLALFLVCTMIVEYFITKYLAIQRKEVLDKDVLFAIVQNKYFNYIVYVTYLVLPSVTTTIFQMFICTNIDPQHESSGDSYYLTADMSISCTTTYYYGGVIYAIVMIFVYPIGIPLLYLKLLYDNRQEIIDRNLPPVAFDDNMEKSNKPKKFTEEEENAVELTTFKKHTTGDDEVSHNKSQDLSDSAPPMDSDYVSYDTLSNQKDFDAVNPMHVHSQNPKISQEEQQTYRSRPQSTVITTSEERIVQPTIDLKVLTMTTSSGRVLSASTTRIAFLWSAYEPKYWYWEIVDTTRRLLLTAVLSVITPGTSGQNVFSMLLALLYIKIYSFFTPYEKRATDILAEVGQYQIFFTFFGAMIFQNDLLDDDVLDVIGASLVIINMSVVVLTIRFQMMDYLDIRRKAGLEVDFGWALLLGFFMIIPPSPSSSSPTKRIPVVIPENENDDNEHSSKVDHHHHHKSLVLKHDIDHQDRIYGKV